MRRRLALACWLGCLALAAPAQTTLTPEDARLTAARLLAAGQYRVAADMTQVLIARDGDDTASLILHAHALRNLGEMPRAQRAARHAWGTADRDLERYGAALAMAQALSSDGHKTRAQVWLRRAAHVAPTPEMRARAVRDYRFVRQTNPWSIDFGFSINPSDNVNNAPRDNTIVLGGLVFTNPSAVAISGFETQTRTNLRFSFAEQQTSRNYLGLGWTESHVVFTDDTVPVGVDASDYAFRRIEASVGRDFITGPDQPRQSVSLSLGRLWSGGDHLADEVRLGWRQTYARPEGRLFSWHLNAGYSDRQDSALRSGVTGSIGGDWSRPLPGGARLSWDAALGRTVTDSRAYTHTSAAFGMQYTLARPVLGAQAQLGLSTLAKHYDDPLYGPDARRDFKTAVSASLLFTDFDSYGFAPRLTLEASRTDSNVTRFETRNFGVQIGFQSLF